MTGAVAVLRREISERRLLFAGAAMLGLLPLAAPLLPGGYAELRGDMALFLGRILSGVLALVLGATVVSRDLAEGRLGFYFSRPLAGGALWTGKFAGAALLACACGLLAAIPGWLAAGAPADSFDLGRLFSWGLAVLSLLFLAHAAGVLLRERSAWLLLDFLAACAVLMLIGAARTSSRITGTGIFEQILVPGTAFAAAVLAGASAVQLLAGRTDLRRSRRLLSLCLWPPLLAGAAALAAYSYRAVQAEPQDLVQAKAMVAAPAGPWVAVTGPVAGLPDYQPGLLIDTRSGRSVLLPETIAYIGQWHSPPAFSADGRRAVWTAGNTRQYTVLSLDLDRPGAKPVVLPVTGDGFSPRLSLSPDGRYLAQINDGRLTVDDLAAGRLVASLDLHSSPRSQETFRFPGGRVLRLFSSRLSEDDPEGVWNLRIQDLDLQTGRLSSPRILEQPDPPRFMPSADGRRLLVWGEAGLLRLHDGATGQKLADLAQRLRGWRLTFLADGRPLVALPHPQGIELLIFQPDGSGEPRRFLLAGIRDLRFGGQPSPGSLVLVTSRHERGMLQHESVQLDLETGRSRPLPAGLKPIYRWDDPLLSGPGSVASRLFLRGDTLVLLDFATGREQALTGEGAIRR